jgi:hypothetical protein
MMSTPGMMGWPGKWPWKKFSLTVTFLMPTADCPMTTSTMRSIIKNGYRCGMACMMRAISSRSIVTGLRGFAGALCVFSSMGVQSVPAPLSVEVFAAVAATRSVCSPTPFDRGFAATRLRNHAIWRKACAFGWAGDPKYSLPAGISVVTPDCPPIRAPRPIRR